MNIKTTFFIFFLLMTSLFQYGWIYEKHETEKSKIGFFSSFLDDYVLHAGIFYFYQVNEKTELGWGVHYYDFNNPEEFLEGSNITLGPMWAHTIAFKKGRAGLRFTMNLWLSLYSSLTSTETKEDKTKFRAEIDPHLLLFKEIKLGKHIRLYPAVGIAAYLTYMQRTEYEEMDKGMVQSHLVLTLPLKIQTGKTGFLMIEPISRILLYSNRNQLVERYSLKFTYAF